MTEGLKALGGALRKRREEMNLSLKEVENATSVRMQVLQAIEEGRVHHFFSGVYATGFIRQYATFLGIEQEQLGREFPDALRSFSEKQEFAYGIGTLESRGSPHGGVRWLPNLLWGLGVAALGIVAWYFGKWVGAF